MNFLNSVKKKLKVTNSSVTNRIFSAERAIEWVKNNRIPNAGIPVQRKMNVPYQEVTGYFIPTLYAWGEKDLARELVRWEISVQKTDGAFSAPDNVPYTFDTGQVVRGFIAALGDIPEVETPLRKACNWILTQIQSDGRLATPSMDMWGTVADDRIHLYVLPPLIEAGERLHESKYVDAGFQVLEYYKAKKNILDFDTLSHFFAYIMEALCDLKETGLAKEGMRQIASLQRKDGSVPAYRDTSWVCTPGLAQFAVIWYKLGMREYADNAMHYLEKVQRSNGGFYGSYGKGANYFASEEISWAVKYFLDAYKLRMKLKFNSEAKLYSESIEEKDGRAEEILSFFGDINGKKVIDVGCGKGRYLKLLMKRFPNAKYYGLDVSEEMLRSCPKEAETAVGSMLDIKYPDSQFDYVFSVEALEHAVNVEAAVKEMARILKIGGKIIIIDKNANKLGMLQTEPWEQWFSPEKVAATLRKYGVEASHKEIPYEQHSQPNGLFIAWEGIKTIKASSSL